MILTINVRTEVQAGRTVKFEEVLDLSAGDMAWWTANLTRHKLSSSGYDFYWTSEFPADLICLDTYNFKKYNNSFNAGTPLQGVVYYGELSAIYKTSFTKTGFRLMADQTLYFAVENADYFPNGAPEVPVTEINISLSYSWQDSTTTTDTTTETTDLSMAVILVSVLFLTIAFVAKKKRDKRKF